MAQFGVQLDSASYMCDPAGNATYGDHANARAVFEQLSSKKMPPDGAWPQSDIDLFRTWMTGGFLV